MCYKTNPYYLITSNDSHYFGNLPINISAIYNRLPWSDNIPHRGKYNCTADLLFDWFDLTKQVKLLFIQHKQSSWIPTI